MAGTIDHPQFHLTDNGMNIAILATTFLLGGGLISVAVAQYRSGFYRFRKSYSNKIQWAIIQMLRILFGAIIIIIGFLRGLKIDITTTSTVVVISFILLSIGVISGLVASLFRGK
jgi:hypothetical protein